jgi:hypothetical protein
MDLRTAAAVILSFVLSPVLHAGDAHPWCGTSAETTETVRELAKLGSLFRAQAKTSAAANVQLERNVIVVEPDEWMIPFANFADIENSSIHFRRTGPETFAVRRGALDYVDDVGTLAYSFTDFDPNEHHLYRLREFAFPFGQSTRRDLYISERFGIFFAAPAPAGTAQFRPLDLATLREALVAPYLEPDGPRPLRSSVIEVFVQETNERVVVTWRSRYDSTRPFNPHTDGALDMQAVLDRDGNIRFSYRKLQNVAWGSVVVTTGNEALRSNTSLLAAADDPAGDAGGIATYRNLLDIRRVEVRRIDGSEHLTVRIRLGGRLYPEVAGDRLTISMLLSQGSSFASFVLFVDRDEWSYCVPGRSCSTAGMNAEFTDDGVILNMLEQQLPFSGPVTFRISTSAVRTPVDSASFSVTLGGGRSVGADLSSFDSERPASTPFYEAFTIPTLNPEGVWDRVRDELGLWDEEVDGVAIFQDFPTDIVFFATAYSTVGNAGANGVWADAEDYIGANLPRVPALLHMNRIFASDTSAGARGFRNFLLGHELGHRWLYGFTIDQEGQPPYVLNPGGAHPAQYVHTPAAFSVMTQRDYSVMGGSNFLDHGDGTFQTPDDDGAWSYSWHELYLMGLAEPREVPDWFYIAESDPALASAYHPQTGLTVRGRRVEVGLRHLTASMGERVPSAADSQKTFRLLFVLLKLPAATAAEEVSLLNETVDDFPPYFDAAVGGRGAVITSLPTQPTAQFTAPERATTNVRVALRDASLDYPARWLWEFGDGRTSTEQFPRHAWTAAGTYTVKLTVENSRGTSSSEQQIVVERAPRRRPAQR